MGVKKLPLAVADIPSTPWKKSGIKIMPPNIPTPVVKITIDATLTILFLNIHRGIMGSLARPSIITKSAVMAAEKTNMLMMGTEIHGYSTPAQDRASIAGTTASISAATPK
jgi:hypothetical protein